MVKSEENKRVSGLIFSSAVGAVVGMLITMVMLYVFSILVAAGKLPPTLGESLIIAACFIGVIIGSWLAAKKRGRGALPCALLCGAVWFLLIVVFALFGEGAVFDTMKLKIGICALAGSAFGSALHVNKAGRKSKRKAR